MLVYRAQFFVIFLIMNLFSVNSVAVGASQVATVARVYGEVKVLSNPNKSIKGSPPHALYDGMYYSANKAKAGVKLEQGSIIQTGASARARLIYDNGDQVTVSSNSAYQVRWDISKPDAKPVVDVLMGGIRSSIQKGGPRSGMTVRTRSAVMGVRGTDFYVNARGENGESEVTVMRGIVAVAPKIKDAKPIEVAAGFSAKVPDPATKTDEKTPPPTIEVAKTSQQEIIAIQKESNLKKAVADTSEQVNQQIAQLEKKASENALADIKATNPELVAGLSKEELEKADFDTLQNTSMKKLFKEAPAVSKFKKPSKKDLEMQGDDTYEKYFKTE